MVHRPRLMITLTCGLATSLSRPMITQLLTQTVAIPVLTYDPPPDLNCNKSLS